VIPFQALLVDPTGTLTWWIVGHGPGRTLEDGWKSGLPGSLDGSAVH
jgi:hypothetical protein